MLPTFCIEDNYVASHSYQYLTKRLVKLLDTFLLKYLSNTYLYQQLVFSLLLRGYARYDLLHISYFKRGNFLIKTWSKNQSVCNNSYILMNDICTFEYSSQPD